MNNTKPLLTRNETWHVLSGRVRTVTPRASQADLELVAANGWGKLTPPELIGLLLRAESTIRRLRNWCALALFATTLTVAAWAVGAVYLSRLGESLAR